MASENEFELPPADKLPLGVPELSTAAPVPAPVDAASEGTTQPLTLLRMPGEVQIHILTFLRAYDLSAVQRTCRFFNDPFLVHEVVTHQVDFVYTRDFVGDMESVAVNAAFGSSNDGNHSNRSTRKSTRNGKADNKLKHNVKPNGDTMGTVAVSTRGCIALYNLEHLRNIELMVVAKILSTPEPKTGFYVSKSWIKKTLLWLEKVNEPQQQQQSQKMSKKQLRQRARRLSDVSPPWPDVNSDIMCTHHNLQRCGVKSARSRRRLMDKQAWKILKKLYPDSTQLDSVKGECLQCLVEAETVRRNEQAEMEQKKLERKKPLTNAFVRRFYTRTRGVPTHCIARSTNDVSDGHTDPDGRVEEALPSGMVSSCPLVPGTYHILPRAWCHQWRRYIKTGEGPVPKPPDATALLCHAHRLALLPPHLEAYLYGETQQLLSTTKCNWCDSQSAPETVAATLPTPNTPVGLRPRMDPNTVNALMMAGLSPAELATQQMAMLQLQEQRQVQQQQPAPMASPSSNSSSSSSLNDLLDRENHVVVEIVTDDEWLALQEMGCCGPRQLSQFTVSFTVSAETGQFSYSTIPCRDCDASGKASSSCMSIKNRARGKWTGTHLQQQHHHNSKRNGSSSTGETVHKHRSPSLEY